MEVHVTENVYSCKGHIGYRPYIHVYVEYLKFLSLIPFKKIVNKQITWNMIYLGTRTDGQKRGSKMLSLVGSEGLIKIDLSVKKCQSAGDRERVFDIVYHRFQQY